ncbi:TonB-dependent receptor [Novosphingobium rhizosphaerae]|uniref:TonB-dependent receptor n=1 Tax=Novosphingobium rhizosphaerae TaxID=1551649 RepID=UPI0017F408BF
MTKMRACAGFSVSVLALAVAATAAQAQDAAQPVAPQQATQGAASGDTGLGEIVVTAQRKSESIQKAAIAIDAVSGNDLMQRGVTNAQDITKQVPAISVTNGGGSNTSIFLRGVGNVTNSSYNDPAVTPSYDGVVLGRAAGAFSAAFYDLQRVEVLKGPQGILYGRNATGGAVNIIPARPELGKNGMGFNLSYGNYDAVNVDGHVNLALGDSTALRVAGTRQYHKGYNRDGSDDLDRSGVRAQLLFEPSSDFSLRLGADWTKVGGVGTGSSYVGSFDPSYNFIPAGFDTSEGLNTKAANAWRQQQLAAPGFGFLNAMNRQQSIDFTYWGVNAELNWNTGLGKLTIIPAYRKSSGESYFYGPAFNTAYANETDNQFSLETRLSGSKGMVDYVLGGFFFDEKIKSVSEYNQEFVLPIQSYTHKTTSWALFGQLTAHVTDRLRLVGGARYTHDHKDMNGMINNFITFCGGAPDGVAPELITPPASFAYGCASPSALPRYPNLLSTGATVDWLKSNGWISSSATDQANVQLFDLTTGKGQILKTYNPVVAQGSYSRVTWKGAVEFDVGPRSLLYASAESGYRAGGFQLAEGRPSYKPEFITAYTIGSKNRFFDNRVQLNLEGFLWKYKDQQITYFTYDTSGTVINSNENAGRSTIKGFDIDAMVRPFAGTTLTGKVQYLDAKYNDLHLYTAAPRDNIGCPYTYTGASAGGAPVKDFNCSGKPLLFAPKWTVNLGAEQVVPVGQELELVGNVNTAWRADQWGAFEYLDFEHIRAYWTTDLALTLRKADGGWSLGGFVSNLENKRRVAMPQLSPIGMAVSHYGAPRTYGVRFSANF